MRLFTTILFLMLVQSALAQTPSTRNEDRTVDLLVTLSFDDGSTFRNVGMGQNAAGDAGKDRASTSTGKHSQEMSGNMQIRVQLQDGFGANLDEATPNGEGRATFRVRNGSTYRIRVTGSEIEEAFVERIEPSQGDRMVSVRLRLKGEANNVAKSNSATTSVVRLNIPSNAQKELDKGNAALGTGDYPQARKHFEKGIELYPQFDMAYNNLGVALMQLGDTQGGRNAFTKAVELNEHFARAYLNLGKIAIDEKRFADADNLLRKCLSNDPLNAHALEMAAQAALNVGKPEDTIADVRTLHSIPHQQYAMGHFFAALAFESQKHLQEALEQYELLIKEAPADPVVSKAKARVIELKQLLQR